MAKTKTARTLARPRTFTCTRPPTVCPAEAFLDPLAQPLADRIAQTCGDLARNRGLARLAARAHRPVDRDVRLDPARLQALDERLGVIALVGAERRALGQALA